MDILALGVGEAADADFPNSSVTVAEGGFRLLIDCGHSVPPVLWRTFADPEAVDAVVFTHRHPDHCFGLVPALIRWADDGRRKPLDLHVAADVRRHLELLFAAGGLDPERDLPFALTWRELEEEGSIGPFRVTTAPTRHAVPNWALRLEAGGKVFAYSGDGRPTGQSEALFRGADLLFHECLSVHAVPSQPHHACLDQLAAFPQDLGVGSMRLYHVWASERAALERACAGRPGLELARPGDRFVL
jgi:ribonuclease BN (tRNA processing enzyme)